MMLAESDIDLDYKAWCLRHGFDYRYPDQENFDGDYALIVASRQGRHELIEQLLADNCNPNCIDPYGNNALWAACYAMCETCIELLLASSCDINYQNTSGNTVLMYAASSGRDHIVQKLLSAGADPFMQNHDDMTAMDLASSWGSLTLLRQCSSSAKSQQKN